MELSIRRLTADDLDAAEQILQVAFERTESCQDELRRALAIEPEGWFLAVGDEGAVGMAGAVDYGPFAYVGFMAVRPEFRRRGIGAQLMERLLAWLDGRGTATVLLDATPAGEPLYRRFGFLEYDHACLLQHPAYEPYEIYPPDVRPMEARDLQVLPTFDHPVFGADRARVFQVLTDDFPSRVFVAEDAKGRIEGYLFAQARQIGPWVATRPGAAERLLAAALTLPFGGPPQVVVPGANQGGMELLHQAGFQIIKTTRHMRRGGTGLFTRRELVYGQTSFAIG